MTGSIFTSNRSILLSHKLTIIYYCQTILLCLMTHIILRSSILLPNHLHDYFMNVLASKNKNKLLAINMGANFNSLFGTYAIMHQGNDLHKFNSTIQWTSELQLTFHFCFISFQLKLRVIVYTYCASFFFLCVFIWCQSWHNCYQTPILKFPFHHRCRDCSFACRCWLIWKADFYWS